MASRYASLPSSPEMDTPGNMATLEELRTALNGSVATASAQSLSDTQYSQGFEILHAATREKIYEDFVLPKLEELLKPMLKNDHRISVLQIGPGPDSVLRDPWLRSYRRRIKRYDAFEPNSLFCKKLKQSLAPGSTKPGPWLPSLEEPAVIHQAAFESAEQARGLKSADGASIAGRYDLVLFCNGMYGAQDTRAGLEEARSMLKGQSDTEAVVVFHHALFPTDSLPSFPRMVVSADGVVRIPDDDGVLGRLAPFIAGCTPPPTTQAAVYSEWPKVCRRLGSRLPPNTSPARAELVFRVPQVMAALNRHSIAQRDLSECPSFGRLNSGSTIEGWAASDCSPAGIFSPRSAPEVQQCVRWAIKHGISLVVASGCHSDHYLRLDVVSVVMSAFQTVSVVPWGEESGDHLGTDLVVVESGCTAEDVVSKTAEFGLVVPLGSHPSVGAGSWLQGGIGRLGRLHGLSCDSIVGAVVVGLESGQVLRVGAVPQQHCPPGAERPENEADLLWALKGAGSNFGIVISVTFKAYAATNYLVHTWDFSPVLERFEPDSLSSLSRSVSRRLPKHCSADVCLYNEGGRPRMAVSGLEAHPKTEPLGSTGLFESYLGPAHSSLTNIELSQVPSTEASMLMMRGGQRGQASTLRRCVFLKSLENPLLQEILDKAMRECPGPWCYIQLVQGGGAIDQVAGPDTAFGCRGWQYACVVNGLWYPDDVDTSTPTWQQEIIRWVDRVCQALLPLSYGAYGADLGPFPTDRALARSAFGLNRLRLCRLKRALDPHGVLPHTAPLLEDPRGPKLVIVVTGSSGSGKDYCADVWASQLAGDGHGTRAVGISDSFKREYALHNGLDMNRLMNDWLYKEEHRAAMTQNWNQKLRQDPSILDTNFVELAQNAGEVDVLLITGMRDLSPVSRLAHLVPGTKLIEIRVESTKTWSQDSSRSSELQESPRSSGSQESPRTENDLPWTNCWPDFTFVNEEEGPSRAIAFTKRLLPLVSPILGSLANKILPVPGYPTPPLTFHHVLNILQHPGGLQEFCDLAEAFISQAWEIHPDTVACCEAGGFALAAGLVMRLGNRPNLALIRRKGKLPPPTLSVTKPRSHISSLTHESAGGGGVGEGGGEGKEEEEKEQLELGRGVVAPGAAVVVVDDVLATGNTLVAVLRLLRRAGVADPHVLVAAEFPAHGGRRHLQDSGFGLVPVHSMIVLGGK